MILLYKVIGAAAGVILVGMGLTIYFLQHRVNDFERERAQMEAKVELHQRQALKLKIELEAKTTKIEETHETKFAAIDAAILKRVRKPSNTRASGVPAPTATPGGTDAAARDLDRLKRAAQCAQRVIGLQDYIEHVVFAPEK